MKKLLLISSLTACLTLFLEWNAHSNRGPITDEQWIQSRYFELGLSAGTPAGLNFCAGYWFGATNDNLLTQICAMHFGSTLNGIQLDFGKAFYRKKNFKAFWAGSFRTSHVELAGTPVDFLGIGPMAGMNWHAFALELGLYVGRGNNSTFFPYQKDPIAGSRLAVQLGFQLGIKGLFWQ